MASFSLNGARIYVTGHNGLAGSAVLRALARRGDVEILTASRTELDLRDSMAVRQFLQSHKPDVVIACAGRVGGIGANMTAPADFIYDNMMIAMNTMHEAFQAGVSKLLYLGSSCMYPRGVQAELKEEMILNGELEPTNDAYAVAKIAGVKMIEAYRRQHGADFIAAIPTNLYGINDRYDAASSHVLPALMLKAHTARQQALDNFMVWGSGTPLREFLYADDLAAACLFLLENYSGDMPINIGSSHELSIAELAAKVAEIVGFNGNIVFDSAKPDGMMRKKLDTTRLEAMGWVAATPMNEGLQITYDDFKKRFAA